MTVRTAYDSGVFAWVDLATSNTVAARSFYGSLFGWDSKDIPTPMGADYTMFLYNGLEVAGMGPQPPDMVAAGAPPRWSSYVRVDDAAATLAKAVGFGATVMMPAIKIMEQGYLAFFIDPTGAQLGLWQPIKHQGAGWVNSVGGFCWNELYTSDVAASKAFYEHLFGWEFSSSAIPGGEYWMIKNGEDANGGMMKLNPAWGEVPPNWTVYFTVESCAGAIEKAESLGGKRFMPPVKVPGVGTFAGLTDEQGGKFIVIEMEARRS